MLTKELQTLKNVFRITLWQKASVFIFLFSSFAAAVTEIVFLGLLYTLFSLDKKNLVLNWIKSQVQISSVHLSFIENNIMYLLIALAIVILLLRLFFAILSRTTLAYIQIKTFTGLSNKLISCFVDTHPAAWFSWKKEKLVNTMTYQTFASSEAVYVILNILMSLIIMFSLIIGAYMISPQLTLFSVFIGIVMLAINRMNYLKARRIGSIKVKFKAELLGQVYDIVSGHKILKLESAEQFAKDRLSGIIKDSYSWLLEKTRNINMVMSFTEIFVYFFLFGLVLVASIFKIFDQVKLSMLLVISMRLQGGFRDLQSQWMNYQELLPNLLDVQKMLSYADTYINKRMKTISQRTNKRNKGLIIRVENVNFSYSDNSPAIINGLSIVFHRGDKILIKGISGSGKSTLINLICGILEPKSGKIFFDEEELTRDNFYNIRNSISYSSPDAYIFRGTIRDNISLGLDTNEEEILESVRKAGLEEFAERLENGLSTQITDNASNISLGERQRLMLARMFLKKPRLILFDEATANLDLELEDKILNNLVENLAGVTFIMVTHRAPKNFVFDKKYELKEGNLAIMD